MKKCSVCSKTVSAKGPSIETWKGVGKMELRIVNYRTPNGMSWYVINDTTDEIFCNKCDPSKPRTPLTRCHHPHICTT